MKEKRSDVFRNPRLRKVLERTAPQSLDKAVSALGLPPAMRERFDAREKFSRNVDWAEICVAFLEGWCAVHER